MSEDILGVMKFLIFFGFFVLTIFGVAAKKNRCGVFDERVLLCLHKFVSYMIIKL